MKKNLVILVADYPNPHGEPFLENELKVISKDFENIYILPKTSEGVTQIIQADKKLFLPTNAKVIPIEITKTKVVSKMKFIFGFAFYYQLFLARFKHKVSLSLSLVKLVLYYLETSGMILKKMQNFIQLERISKSETVYYSYWCDEGAYALSRLKKKDLISDYVTRLHGWDVYFERHSQNFLPFRESIFNYASFIFPISNDARKYLLDKKMSIHPEKIITSRLGVSSIEKIIKHTKDNKVIYVLTISHINKVKRLDRLIDALSTLDEIEVRWSHIGWGIKAFEEKIKCQIDEKLAKKNNIHVQFLGEFSKDQVFSYLENERIDVLINCSENEGVPVSIMEAFSAGIPVIAYNIGGIPEIIDHGKNGILLDVTLGNHVDQLKEAILSISSMPLAEYSIFCNNAIQKWSNDFNKSLNYDYLSYVLKNNVLPNVQVVSCKQCLVDSVLYPSIVIDKYGICNVCRIVEKKNNALHTLSASNHIDTLLNEVKSGKVGRYDCIIGISGGVDSAYLALKAREWGLNPLLVHIDNGWNSELAVFNIQTLIKELNYDLYTVVINWKELRDVVRSFFKASVIDIDWANEMCAQAALYEVCNKFGLKYILTGHQIATEGWMPDNIVHYKLDLINFKAIHRKFGERKLNTYPTIGYLKTYYYEKIKKIKYISPLDYIPYNKEEVKKELIEKFGWRDYGQKHFESIFTRFYQAYLLPKKFKVDKRRFHYSASILSGQMTKESATSIIKSNEYIESGQVYEDMEFIIKKLGFTREEIELILKEAPKSHFEYPSILRFRKLLTKFKHVIQNTY